MNLLDGLDEILKAKVLEQHPEILLEEQKAQDHLEADVETQLDDLRQHAKTLYKDATAWLKRVRKGI